MQGFPLLPLLFKVYSGPTPGILLIHLGGNRLDLVEGRVLDVQTQEDLLVKYHK